ncbi:MAG: outer membrane beta-barrel protein [Verrucomicrobia bacterium]|nr:outer membrane beta-barrel protein [Verrucomicrobiota bacterium]
MKNYSRLVIALAALTAATHAAPFLAIGDGAELFATGTLGVRADDNIFLDAKATSDTIFDINPGLTLEFGKNAELKGSLAIIDSFANYSDHSSLNTNLFSADFNANFDDGKTKLSFNAGYHEMNQNTVDTALAAGGKLTRRDQFVVGTKGEVEISQITSVAAGVNFDHMNYKVSGYGDTDELKVPVNFYYKWTPKTDISLGYSYSNYQTTIGQDSNDHFFSVGLRGEVLPLLKGEIAVGVDQRNISGGSSKTDPGLTANLTYEYSPKTTLTFTAGNNHGTSPQGAQQKNFSLGGKVNVAIDSAWSVDGGLNWRNIAYSRFGAAGPHEDDYVEGTVGAGYIVNSWVKIKADYTYRNNSSNTGAGEFTGNVFTLSASLRY